MSASPPTLPTVAIIGRPNVGKSTLFNRLTGSRHALVANTPGLTRDRREAEVTLDELTYRLIDTAGLEEAESDSLAGRMTNQTMQAIREADILLMLVDVRAGILPTDHHFARLIRESGKPVILAVNKAEGRGAELGAADAYQLGLGDPLAISAEHGEGIAGLYDALFAHFDLLVSRGPSDDSELEGQAAPLQIAVVGRPNVGKSTFVNQLLGQERLLTGPEAGITRDAISIPFRWRDQTLTLIDTAGMRRKSRVAAHDLEVMAVNDTRRAIQYAPVIILMMDATQPLEKQDNHIAALLADEGRACVLVLNKWDLVEDKDAVLEEVHWQIERLMPAYRGMPVIPISAIRGQSLDRVVKACLEAYSLWNKRIGTSELNRWLETALDAHTPPLVNGRRLKIKYITQAKARPPSFALFVNHKGGIPAHYRRYLINSLRETFRLPGIPIRLLIRRGKNPYENT